jgi:hypothetical protein
MERLSISSMYKFLDGRENNCITGLVLKLLVHLIIMLVLILMKDFFIMHQLATNLNRGKERE